MGTAQDIVLSLMNKICAPPSKTSLPFACVRSENRIEQQNYSEIHCLLGYKTGPYLFKITANI